MFLESFCDNCSAGMLQPLLDKGYLNDQPWHQKGQTVTCPKCNHENTVDEVYMVLPTEFIWLGDKDYTKAKTDKSLKNFLKDDEQKTT